MAAKVPEVTERLTEDEFDRVFGQRVSQAIAFDGLGRCVVNSAITRTRYVYWDWTARRYMVEPRKAGAR